MDRVVYAYGNVPFPGISLQLEGFWGWVALCWLLFSGFFFAENFESVQEVQKSHKSHFFPTSKKIFAFFGASKRGISNIQEIISLFGAQFWRRLFFYLPPQESQGALGGFHF